MFTTRDILWLVTACAAWLGGYLYQASGDSITFPVDGGIVRVWTTPDNVGCGKRALLVDACGRMAFIPLPERSP
jgi:hypothetical protein